MKTLILAGVATLALTGVAAAQNVPTANVAVVDTDRIASECTACRAAATQLQSQVTALQGRARTLEQPIATEAQAIQTAVNALAGRQPDAALQARATRLQQQQATARQELETGRNRIASTQENVRRQISARLQPIINTVMQRRGANMAVDGANTLAHASQLNITTEVLTELNRQLPSVSITPLPQQPAAAQPAPAQQQPPRPRGR